MSHPEENGQTSERRIAPRVDLEAPAHFRAGVGEASTGTVVNVSETGAFLETVAAADLEQPLHVSFELPEGYGSIEAVAKVVYRNPFNRARSALRPGLGLRFVSIEDRYVQCIRAYVEHHAAHVDRFDRDLLGIQPFSSMRGVTK